MKSKRRWFQAVMFSGVLSVGALAVAPPAFAGGWTAVPCPGDGSFCTDGNGIYQRDVGKFLACDSTAKRFATTDLDGVEWVSSNGTHKCVPSGGAKG
jgi:hypothetical protein